MYRLPTQLRAQLAQPLAPVLPTAEAIAFVDGREVVSVGDVVTQMFLDHGIVPRLMVVDGVTQRDKPTDGNAPRGLPADIRRIEVANPAAEITQPLWDAVEAALASDAPTLIQVTGEEDLAALPALILAPDGAVVAYGQPHEGVVAVLVDARSRARAQTLLDQMEVN